MLHRIKSRPSYEIFLFSYQRIRIRKRGRAVNVVVRTIAAYRQVFLRKSAMTADDRRHTAVRSRFLRQGTSGPEVSDSLTDIAGARLGPKLFTIVCKISISCITCSCDSYRGSIHFFPWHLSVARQATSLAIEAVCTSQIDRRKHALTNFIRCDDSEISWIIFCHRPLVNS